MPVRYSIEPERGLIRTRCTGDVTFAEVMDHFQEIEEDPAVPDRLDVLLDLSALTSIPTTEQLRVVAETAGQVRARVRWGALAITVSRDTLFGSSRQFEVFAERHFARIRVFRDPAEAWLPAFRAWPRLSCASNSPAARTDTPSSAACRRTRNTPA
jgi:hypothetical protein